MITVQDWAQIRYLHGSEQLSIRAIASRLGLSRETVSRAVSSSSPPKYSRVSGPSAFDAFESQVRALLAQFPAMPASVLAERVGWSGSASWFRKKVALLRVDRLPGLCGVPPHCRMRLTSRRFATTWLQDWVSEPRRPCLRTRLAQESDYCA